MMMLALAAAIPAIRFTAPTSCCLHHRSSPTNQLLGGGGHATITLRHFFISPSLLRNSFWLLAFLCLLNKNNEQLSADRAALFKWRRSDGGLPERVLEEAQCTLRPINTN